MFSQHFSLQFFHVSQCFRKKIGRIILLFKSQTGWMKKDRILWIQNLLQKAVFVLQLLFGKSNYFCNKTDFCNIIYKRILYTLHDVFKKMGVKIMHKHSF